jgi:hypothetical protein
VQLWAYNDSFPGGVSANLTVHVVVQPVHYVALTSANPQPPYATWATAATNIQDALDLAAPGSLVWVDSGMYQTGARMLYGMSNRVAVTKPVSVRSVQGPEVTVIGGCGPVGAKAVRCVYLAEGAQLTGFTLTNGATQASGNDNINMSGGGVWCESRSAVVRNCVLAGNSASYYGGGAFNGDLSNCTLTGNSAGSGGGAYHCPLQNCIVYYNFYYNSPNNYDFGGLAYCCTTPMPDSGTGNITAAPLFVNTNGWSDLRLQAGSLCINAGNNDYAPGSTDLSGNPRILDGTVDMGAYESSVVLLVSPRFTSWLWLTNAFQCELTGQVGRAFEICASTNLQDWTVLVTLTNVSGTVVYTDLNATNYPLRFFRAVQLP